MNDTILEYLGSCHYISASDNQTLPCEAWEYNRTDYQSTIVTDASIILFYNLFYHNCFIVFVQWDLVCDRRWMASVSQSVYMLGDLVASSLLGQLSDRWIYCDLIDLVLSEWNWTIELFENCIHYLDMAVRRYCSRPECFRYTSQLSCSVIFKFPSTRIFFIPKDGLRNSLRFRQ